MTFSFTLVLGLFLLAPGLAVFAGVYHGSRLGPVESSPPPPGSILALSIVTVGALIAHLLGALLYWLQELYCGRFSCFRVSHDPNVYASLFTMTVDKNATVTGLEIVAILLTLVLLTAGAFFGTRRIVTTFAGEAALKTMLYGWLAEVAVAKSETEVVLAYVVSDVQEDGTIVGYEGAVANLTTNAEKQITSILLDSCEIFHLRVTPAGVARGKARRGSDIGQLYLDNAHIRNVAFERVRFANDRTAP